MKKRMKQAVALALGASMALGMMTGCGGNKDNNNSNNNSTSGTNTSSTGKKDTSEHLDLKMYLIGDRTPDFDAVYAKINEILEEKLNCSLSVDFLSWGEHDTKYSLLFSGKEDFDLIFTASSWCHYEQTVSLGGFAEMTEEFIKTYAPDIWEVVPAVAWEQAKIDGKIYMVPNYNNEFGQDVLAIRGDLLKKYGMDDITTWDELREFYMACAKDGMYASQGGPWYQYFQAKGMTGVGGTPQGGELILFNTQDPSDTEVYSVIDWDGFSEYCHQVKEMADAGCWSADVLNSTDERQTGLMTGKTAVMAWNLGSCLNIGKEIDKANPEYEITIVDPVANLPKRVNSYINNGVAININSQKKERAMMVLNEFYTNPAVYDLAMLGIEGTHWKAIGDDQYQVIDESNYGVNNNCNWGWNNANLTRQEYIENRTALDDRYEELKSAWDKNIKPEHPLDGFNFDNSKVASQVAAVEANVATYFSPLVNGLVDDVDATIEAFRQSLKTAGMDMIMDELRAQVADYVANK